MKISWKKLPKILELINVQSLIFLSSFYFRKKNSFNLMKKLRKKQKNIKKQQQ